MPFVSEAIPITLQGISDLVDVLKGHDFSRAEKTAKSTWALAPEGIVTSKIDLF
jgi:hypothetical protein